VATAPRGPRIVVIGGGTGSFATLLSLKNYTRNITAIVSMSDDGGSTGILRDELGVLPPGDIRQCLVALSESDQTMRDLFNYRFEEGTFEGHSFGNLFLTALEKTSGSFATAVATASEILKISGRVLPVTLTDSKLVYTRPDGREIVGQYAIRYTNFDQEVVGEHAISQTDFEGDKHPQLSLRPQAKLNPLAKEAILEADLVVIAPGNLYGSLAPALIVDGMGEALKTTSARVVYVSNLVTKPGQTDGFTVADYAREIERLIGGRSLDYVLYNSHKPSRELLEKYAAAGEYAVEFDSKVLAHAHYRAIGEPLVSDTVPKLKPAEQLIPRTLIRHDSDRLARMIMRVYFT
jgi:uncharacterized cofD-like protein